MEYVTTKEECERNIRGVCEGCGRELSAIKTVDNLGRPTFWQGCEHCSRFRSGIDQEYFAVARKLVEDGEIAPYHHMVRCDYDKQPESLDYYLNTQTASASRLVKRIHLLIKEQQKAEGGQ